MFRLPENEGFRAALEVVRSCETFSDDETDDMCVVIVTGQAFVTLATSDDYALGALVLSRSLHRVNTTRQLVVMVTAGVSQPMRSVSCV